MNHLLSIQALTPEQIRRILELTQQLKPARAAREMAPLANQIWALIFNKASTRTRVSFEVAIRELGGQSLFLAANEIQLGRGEPIKDTARVLGRLVHGAVIRTFAQEDVVEFAHYGQIPTINALTDEEHPCQILADLFTIQEKLGSIDGKTISFIGDGDCNVARSWIWAAHHLGFTLRVVAPPPFQPPAAFLEQAGAPNISVTADVAAGLADADVIYTDVWVSMGKEDALIMHCLPAYREKEISTGLFEAHADTIFDQAENRLHAQKAILTLMAEGNTRA
jgi:ornithine carbamoyltransferase